MANDNVIISRFQNLRGLKQDLPQPLRAGEIGFTTDSKQIFIGSDTTDATSDTYNKIAIFENVSGAENTTLEIANVNLVSFGVPHRRFLKGEMDGVATAKSWAINAEQYTGAGRNVFRPEITSSPVITPAANTTSNVYVQLSSGNTYVSVGDVVTGNDITGNVTVSAVSGTNVTLSSAQSVTTANAITFTTNDIVSIVTSENFKAADVDVMINGTRQVSSPNLTSVPANSDFIFATTTLGSDTHDLTFRVAPLATEEVGLTYYDKNAMVQALSAANTIYSGSNSRSFYAEQNISFYREIDPELVRVSESAGTGLIGLQFKHVAVAVDGSVITTPGSVTLGNLLVSRDSHQETTRTIVSTGTSTANIAITAQSLYDATYDYVYVQDAGVQWLNNKTLSVDSFDTANIAITLPSGNSWSLARQVTCPAAVANVVTLTGDVTGLRDGDYVIFDGANAAYFDDGTPYQVSSVTLTGFNVTEGNVTVAQTAGDLTYINYGIDNTGANVQIVSAGHGLPVGANIDIVTSSVPAEIAVQEYTTLEAVTANTYFIATTTPANADITGTANVVLGPASNVSITPTQSIDLSSATTVTAAIAIVDALEDYPFMAFIPTTINRVYFSHKPAYDSVGVNFTLHEDSVGTLAALGLTAGNYTKEEDTVKAKLERWLNALVIDPTINLLTFVDVGTKYSTYNISNLGTYTLNLDSVNDQISFNTRDEVRDFNYVVNSIYHDRTNANVRGLLNLKTNIELVTRDDLASASAVTTFSAPNDITIPAAGLSNSTVIVSADVDEYDVHFIDYSVKDTSVAANVNYIKAGTLMISVHDTAFTGNVSINDVSNEITDSGVTSGTIAFTAAVDANNAIVINVTNTLNTSGIESTMRFVNRRWKASS